MSAGVSAGLIDGQAVAARVRAEVAAEVGRLVAAGEPPPGLATVLVGDDPASATYVRMKQRDCVEVGIEPHDHRLGRETAPDELAALLERLNGDPAVDGILLQLPLPAPLDGAALTGLIRPEKDVDGLTALSAGRLALGQDGLRPCTPTGVLELLDGAGVELSGAEAVVLGRSNLVGKPLAALLLARDATVTSAHSRTHDLDELCARADVLVVAVGRAGLVRGSWIKPGATVIDVGTNRGPDGRLVGDVAFDEARERAGLITPVPGGVGPMTRAMLLRNTLRAAAARRAARAEAAR